MRLIHTKSMVLAEFSDLRLPENGYAILSHRWLPTHEEVSFDDLMTCKDTSQKRGFAKLKGFCDLASSLGFDYAWCDTCCEFYE